MALSHNARCVLIIAGITTGLSACDSSQTPPSTQHDASPDLASPDRATPDLIDTAERFRCDEERSGDAITAELGPWEVQMDPIASVWSLSHRGAAILESKPLCAGASDGSPGMRISTGSPRITQVFGGFQMDLVDDAALEWSVPASFSVRQGNDQIAIQSDVGTLLFERDGDDLSILFGPEDGSPVESGVEWSFVCGPEESFFGLGAQTFGMDLRGGRFPLWTQEQGIGKPDEGGRFPINNIPEASYAPMGVLHSSNGYAALATQDGYTELDLCDTALDTVSVRSFRQPAALLFVDGTTPKDRMTRITHRVGRLESYPVWAFAPWNDAVGGIERLREIADVLRSERIPSGAIWSEDWAGAYPTASGFRLTYAWEWDPNAYPDLPSEIDDLHFRGFAFLGYFNTFVPNTTKMWNEGEDAGYLIQKEGGGTYTMTDPAVRTTSMVDLTNPDARAWLEGYMVRAIEEVGLDGWMADFSEWLPHDAVLHDGDPWIVHNQYPVLFQSVNKSAFARTRPQPPEAGPGGIFFARSGWASANGGSPGSAASMWGGDQNTDWGFDDGYPSVVPLGVHLGMSGVALFGSDVAGYSSFAAPYTTKELFLRWSTMAAFHPIMRTHHGSRECSNWSFDRDAETLAHYRRWTSVHTLLLPVFQSLADEAMTKGWPIVRHPHLVEGGRPSTPRGDPTDMVFFLGDNLLVAPVLTEGATTRSLRLPAPGWWSLFGNAPESSTEINVSAGPTEIPVYVRPGTILPLLGDVVDTFYPAQDPAVRGLESVTGSYRIALYPDGAGSLQETTVGAAQIVGQSWVEVGLDNPESVRVNEATTALCDPVPVAPCISAAGILFVEGGDLTIEAEGATLEIRSSTQQSYQIGLGGSVYGSLREPTEITDLAPDIDPPCETP